LALVLALGGLGIGYAMWSDTVSVVTTVQTGTVKVALSQYDNDLPPHGVPGDTLSYFQPPFDPSEFGQWTFDLDRTPVIQWEGTRYGKNVASTNSTFNNEAAGGPTASIIIDNAYPSYYSSTLFDVRNIGTIPVKLKSVKLIQLSRNGVPVAWDQDLVWNAEYLAFVLDPSQTWDFKFMITSESFGEPLTQIEPGRVGFFDVDFHLEQGGEQNTQFDFVIQLVFCNWNE